MTMYKHRNHGIHINERQGAPSEPKRASLVARTRSKATDPKINSPRPNACAAISIVFAMYEAYGIIESIPKMHASDMACLSTLENEKTKFGIRKLVLELTQSIQHTGTPVHEVRQKTRTPVRSTQHFGRVPKQLPGYPPYQDPPGYRTPITTLPPRGVATGPRT